LKKLQIKKSFDQIKYVKLSKGLFNYLKKLN